MSVVPLELRQQLQPSTQAGVTPRQIVAKRILAMRSLLPARPRQR